MAARLDPPVARHGPAAAAAPASLGEVLDFMRLLWAVDHALQQRSKQMLRSHGVTGPQRLVLRVLGRCPGLAAGELAELLHIHPSTLTGILKRLASQHLIERSRHPGDGRRAVLDLTARGKKIDRDKTGSVEQLVRRGLADLPPGEVQAAALVLRRLARELELETPPRRRR